MNLIVCLADVVVFQWMETFLRFVLFRIKWMKAITSKQINTQTHKQTRRKPKNIV